VHPDGPELVEENGLELVGRPRIVPDCRELIPSYGNRRQFYV